MELRKRGDVWHVSLTNEAGLRVRRTTGQTNKQQAQRIAARLQQDIWDLEAQGQGGRSAITLSDATARYTTRLSINKKASHRNAVTLRAKLLGLPGRWGFPPGIYMHQVTTSLINDLITARTLEGNGPQTIAHELKLLRAASVLAHSEDHRTADLKSWCLPSLPIKTRYLTIEEYRELVAYLTPPTTPGTEHYAQAWQDAQDLVVTLGLTGGRWGEVSGLTWAQADAPRFDQCKLWGRKTGKERMAPVTTALKGILQRRWDAPGRGGALVFPNGTGGQRSGSCRPILKAMDKLGFNSPESVAKYGRATAHSLRHTFASWLLQSGAGLAEVRDMLGHSTLQMTLRYTHLENATVAARMAERLNTLTEEMTA